MGYEVADPFFCPPPALTRDIHTWQQYAFYTSASKRGKPIYPRPGFENPCVAEKKIEDMHDS